MNRKFDFFRKNARYLVASAVLLMAFLIARGTFTKDRIKADDCQDGQCSPETESQLTDRAADYYVDDLLKGDEPGYYRLTYRIATDKKTAIGIRIADYLDKDQAIGETEADQAAEPEDREILFRYPGGYSNAVFSKRDPNDGANVAITDVHVSELDVSDEAEFAALKPTVFGRASISQAGKGQEDSSYEFPWLKTPKTTLIQAFKAETDYVSGVALKLDVIKDIDPSSREYVLSVKEADFDGQEIAPKGSTVASISFSVASDLEKYRQADGTYLFPLFGRLKKGATYVLMLDNSKVDADDSNYLDLYGSRDDNAYAAGSAAVKQGKSLYRISGDLYFRIYGIDFSQYDGQRLLAGASVSDLGKGNGQYRYYAEGTQDDLLDLDWDNDAFFDPGKKAVLARAKEGRGFSYRFHIGHPITGLSFQAESVKPGWPDAKIYYSFDGENWDEIPGSDVQEQQLSDENSSDETTSQADDSQSGGDDEDSAVGDGNGDDSSAADVSANSDSQRFDFRKDAGSDSGEVYLKILYDPNSANKTKYFGLKNLRFSADFRN